MFTEVRRHLGDDTIEIQRYAYGLFGAPGKKRSKRGKQTEQSRKKNKKQRGRYIQRLMLANFKPGDLHVILQHRKEDRPETFEDGKNRLKAFLRRIRKYYKDRGYECKYIAVTERGKRRAVLHHHIILEAIDENAMHTLPAITACWDGYVKTSVLYEDGNFEQLAEYLVKAEGKEECEGASYSRSRNLKEPVVEKKTVFRRGWDETPTAPEGWKITGLVNKINPYTGKPCQRYFLKRIKNAESRLNVCNTENGKTAKPRQITDSGRKKRKNRLNVCNIPIVDKLKKAAGRLFHR